MPVLGVAGIALGTRPGYENCERNVTEYRTPPSWGQPRRREPLQATLWCGWLGVVRERAT